MLAVIGDIHGSYNTLNELIANVIQKYRVERFIFLGDLIDRGAGSKQTVDLIISLQNSFEVTVLRGNHEEMLLSFLNSDERFPNINYHQKAGVSTIASFVGIAEDKVRDLDKSKIIRSFDKYRSFFEDAIEYYICDYSKHRFLFSHAGPAFIELPPERQYEFCSKDQLAVRYPFLWHKTARMMQKSYYDYVVVFGHDALVHKNDSLELKENVEPFVKMDGKNEHVICIDIDTGAVYGGKLTAMIIDNDGNFTFESLKSKDNVDWF